MKNVLVFLSLVLLLSLIISCRDHDQIITAKFVDTKTGFALDSVYVHYAISHYEHSRGSQFFISEGFYEYSNKEGEIWIYLPEDHGYAVHFVGKEGYRYDHGVSFDNPVRLTRTDCVLRILAKNEYGIHDSLYAVFKTPLLSHYAGEKLYYPRNFPIKLAKGESFTQDFEIPSEAYTYLYWDKTLMNGKDLSLELRDSIYIEKGDTLTYEIKY